ncbi:MAG: hypothetical protein AAFQ53_12585, partial [Bacteroidota bacterium]
MDRFDSYLEEVEQVLDDPSPASPGNSALIPWPDALDSNQSDIAAEAVYTDSLQVLIGRGAVALTVEDSARVRRPILALVVGDLSVSGPLTLAPGSILAATGDLVISPDVAALDVIAYAHTLSAAGASLSGQFLTRTGTRLYGGSRLTYPSIVYVEGEDMAPVRVEG